MAENANYVEQNDRERARMRAIVERLSDEDLARQVHPLWTVAGILGHIAFWDGRVSVLAEKLERGEPFTPSDMEPEDVDWINDAARPLIHAVPPRELARLALDIAKKTDARVAATPADRMYPQDPDSPINAVRASHRGEHLDQIEAALREPRSGA